MQSGYSTSIYLIKAVYCMYQAHGEQQKQINNKQNTTDLLLRSPELLGSMEFGTWARDLEVIIFSVFILQMGQLNLGDIKVYAQNHMINVLIGESQFLSQQCSLPYSTDRRVITGVEVRGGKGKHLEALITHAWPGGRILGADKRISSGCVTHSLRYSQTLVWEWRQNRYIQEVVKRPV